MAFVLRCFTRAYVLAALALALGIGISTALFSLFDAVLLRPLPFPDQDSLYVIWKADPAAGSDYEELAYPELLDMRENIDAFESVALIPTTLYGNDHALQIGNEDPIRVETARVTPAFFQTLGVKPLLGRDFAATDNTSGAGPVAILSHWAWREHFDADPGVVGRQIRISERGHTVIGVMGADIDFPRGAALWMPQQEYDNRGAWFLHALARRKPGYSREQMQAQLDALFTRLAREHPNFYSPTQKSVVTSLPDHWAGSTRPQLLLSMAASLLLLGAACVTALNLFGTRMLTRTQEIATRVSLGASPWRIARQLLGECSVIASFACLAGLALALGLIEVLGRWVPASIPRADQAVMNWHVFAFAILAAIVAVFGSAAAPVWLAARTDVEPLLRKSAGRVTGGGRRALLQGLLTSAQTAIAVVLLAGGALLIGSVRHLLQQDVGFARDAVTMNLAQRGTDSDLFFKRLLERLKGSPGVIAAGAVLMRPLQGSIGWDTTYALESETTRPGRELPIANFEVVTPGYFEALGTPLLRGRDFNEQDDGDAPSVVMINRSLADRLERRGVEPLGARIKIRTGSTLAMVVGIVANARYRGVREDGDDVYVPYLQTQIPVRHLVIRGNRPASELAALVREETFRLDSAQPPAQVETIREAISRNAAADRFIMALVVALSVGALLLAVAGVFSVISETIAQRRREIAIRSALGATQFSLTRQLTSKALRFVFIGEVVGLVVLAISAPWLSPQLYQLEATDPAVLTTIATFLFAVATAAATLPSWSAAGRRPTAGLRDS
ncbi:MAG: ABC transporter permease [Bryobacterales bacterium]|nr:ABC transporter permease [Acidobacteriota bacterium]MCB9384809.1 ABC transporter permease [Bryobacterales bacterium]